jgi:hypothetical protein
VAATDGEPDHCAAVGPLATCAPSRSNTTEETPATDSYATRVQPAPSCTDTVFVSGAAVVVGAAVVAGEVARVVGTTTTGDVMIGTDDSATEDTGTDELDSTVEFVLGSAELLVTAKVALGAGSRPEPSPLPDKAIAATTPAMATAPTATAHTEARAEP